MPDSARMSETAEFRSIEDCVTRCEDHRSFIFQYVDRKWVWLLSAIAGLAIMGASVAWTISTSVQEVTVKQAVIEKDVSNVSGKVDDLHRHFLGKSK